MSLFSSSQCKAGALTNFMEGLTLLREVCEHVAVAAAAGACVALPSEFLQRAHSIHSKAFESVACFPALSKAYFGLHSESGEGTAIDDSDDDESAGHRRRMSAELVPQVGAVYLIRVGLLVTGWVEAHQRLEAGDLSDGYGGPLEPAAMMAIESMSRLCATAIEAGRLSDVLFVTYVGCENSVDSFKRWFQHGTAAGSRSIRAFWRRDRDSVVSASAGAPCGPVTVHRVLVALLPLAAGRRTCPSASLEAIVGLCLLLHASYAPSLNSSPPGGERLLFESMAHERPAVEEYVAHELASASQDRLDIVPRVHASTVFGEALARIAETVARNAAPTESFSLRVLLCASLTVLGVRRSQRLANEAAAQSGSTLTLRAVASAISAGALRRRSQTNFQVRHGDATLVTDAMAVSPLVTVSPGLTDVASDGTPSHPAVQESKRIRVPRTRFEDTDHGGRGCRESRRDGDSADVLMPVRASSSPHFPARMASPAATSDRLRDFFGRSGWTQDVVSAFATARGQSASDLDWILTETALSPRCSFYKRHFDNAWFSTLRASIQRAHRGGLSVSMSWVLNHLLLVQTYICGL